MREKIINMKEKRDYGNECDLIRKIIVKELSEMWQTTSEKRKASREIMAAIETKSNETMMYHIGKADQIIGGREW